MIVPFEIQPHRSVTLDQYRSIGTMKDCLFDMLQSCSFKIPLLNRKNINATNCLYVSQ